MNWRTSCLGQFPTSSALLERTFLSKKAASSQKKNHKYLGVVLSALTGRKKAALFFISRHQKGRFCRISGRGSVLYRQERAAPGAQAALQSVIDTAKMTSEYMAILKTAPQLKASGLDGGYRSLADFGGTVLAGHPTERGVQFVTWEWNYDREGVHHGHYFQNDYDAAKRDFTVRSGLVPKDALFEPEQLAQIYHALSFVREQDETLSFGRDQELAELMDQISGLLPPNAPRQRDSLQI